MFLLLDELKAHSLIDLPRRMQDVIGPQAHPAVSTGNREVDALLHQTPPDTKAARRRFDQQQTQLRDVVRLSDQENTSDSLTIPFRDPASLGRGIEVLHEIHRDLLDQVTEAMVPTVFLIVDLAVTPDDPVDIVSGVGAESEIRL